MVPAVAPPGPLALTWDALKRCSGSLIALIGGLLALLTAQGQEALITVIDAQERLWIRLPGLLLAVWIWALSIWYWAVWNLSFRRNAPTSIDLPSESRSVTAVVLGALAFLAAVVAVVLAIMAQGDGSAFELSIGLGVLVFALVASALAFIRLTQLVNRRLRKQSWPAFAGLANVFADGAQRRQNLLGSSRAERSITRALLVLLLVAITLSAIDAEWLGSVFHPTFLVLAGLSLWLPVFAHLAYWTRRFSYPLVLPAVTLLVFVASFVNDNHDLRAVPEVDAASTGWITTRPTPKRHMLAWRNRPASPSSTEAGTAVFVATAGGGIRAALWTAEVLGRIHDRVPDFADRTIAISGVSGGSLGASVYLSVIARRRENAGKLACQDRKGKETESVRECALAALDDDYLAPVTASLLFSDAFQWFIPAPLGFQDRAGALERAWESSWRGRFKDFDPPFGLVRSFHRLWPSETWPALLLNGAAVETGSRVIVSNLSIENAANSAVTSFVDAFDFFHVYRKNIRLSSAANLSGRFPYIEPAASIAIDCGRGEGQRDRTRCLAGRARSKAWGHIVDGGYFENYGAVTLADLLRDIYEDRRSYYLSELVPVVIQISSDPDLELSDDGTPRRKRAHGYLRESLNPLRTFWQTRSARGIQAVGELRRLAVEELDGVFFHFRLCKLTKTPDPPLGWTISRRSLSSIVDRMMSECGDNAKELDRLQRCLSQPRGGDRRTYRQICSQ